MAVKLESLIIDLQVNAAAMRVGLKEANDNLKGFQGRLDEIAKRAKQAAAVVAIGIGKEAVMAAASFIHKGIELQDQLTKASRAAGQSVEEFSKVAHVFYLADVGTDELSRGLKVLNDRITEAATISSSKANMFKAMGVAIRDNNGTLKNANQILGDVADAFSKMEDSPAKSALAVDLFGRAGARMINALNEGKEGLKAGAEEAQRFGLVVSTQAGLAAEQFADNLKRVERVGIGLAAQVAANIGPTFDVFMKKLLESKEGAEAMKGAVDFLTAAMRLLMSAGAIVSGVFQVVGKTLGRAASIIWDTIQGNWREAGGNLLKFHHDVVKDIIDTSKGVGSALKDIWDPKPIEASTKRVAKASGKTAQQILEDAMKMEQAGKIAAQSYKRLEEVALGLEQQIEAFGGTEVTEMAARLDLGDLSKELENIGSKAVEMRERIMSAVRALHELKLARELADMGRDAERKNAAGARDRARQIEDYKNIGETEEERIKRITAGFDSFEGALKAAADSQMKETAHLMAAKQYEGQGSHELAQKQRLLADAAGDAAEKAKVAAGGFSDAAKEAARQAAEVKAKLKNAFADLGNTLRTALSGLFAKMGASGEIAQTGWAAFQSGGIWAALAAIIIDLMSRMRSWGDLMDKSQKSVDKLMGDIGGGLEAVIQALMVFQEALQPLKDLLHKIIDPLLKIIAMVIDVFASLSEVITSFFGPALEFIGELFKNLEVVLRPIITAIKALLEVIAPIAKLFGSIGIVLETLMPVFWVIGKVLGVVALTLLGIAWVFGKIINAISGKETIDTKTMEKQMEQIGKEILGKGNATALEPGGAISGDTSPNSRKDIDESQNTRPMKGFNEVVEETTKTVAKFNNALTNVPEGFKVALRRFQAMAPAAQIGSVGGASAFSPGLVTPSVTINVNGSIMSTAERVATLVEDVLNRRRFRESGVPPVP